VRFLAFGGSAARLISSGDDGALRLWDTGTGEKLAEVITTASGWAVIDRQGRFDGSEQGMNDVGWHARDQEIPLESLSEQFFEPGLLARYLDKKKDLLVKVPANVTDGIALPPKVEIDLPEASREAGKPFPVVVVVTDQGGGIEAVRLYHNGKLVQPGSLMQQREVEAKGQRIRAVAFQVKPVPGINSFRAVATGLWGIEAQSARLSETFAGDGPLPTLHVLAVGINKYSDPKLTLGYSVPDAKSIVAAFEQSAKGTFSDVVVHPLYDGKATRAGIMAGLKSLAGVDQNDVVVIYLAGHGIVVGDDWVFLPYEARFQKTFENYRKGAVTAREIQDALVDAQAQRVLVMIDSCQSGATVETFEQLQNFERRYIRNFSRVAGVTVIAASRRDQGAIELPSLGHGLFTYVVLEGLTGNADSAPKDGSVTAHEIVQYADAQIPGMSQRYLDEPQVPMAFALGADFPLRGK
jgi:Caspase domain